MPSFTCPNNMSIVTGSEPENHGISGNFFIDPETQEPVVMTGPELLRSRSIMSQFSREGAKVVSITAKDKLRKQLQKDMKQREESSDNNISLAARWAPRESSKKYGWLARKISEKYFENYIERKM